MSNINITLFYLKTELRSIIWTRLTIQSIRIDVFRFCIKLIFALWVCSVFSFVLAADRDIARQLFDQGNAAFARQDYEEALAFYQKCLSEFQSAALHYNLANAYTQLDAVGPAILHYEKALSIQPYFAEARANLEWIRQQEQLPKAKKNVVTRLADVLSLRFWTILITIGFWSSLALILLLWLWHRRLWWPRIVLSGCLTLFIVALIGLIGYHLESKTVVVLTDADLRVAPTQESPANAVVRAGELGKIRKAEYGYYLIQADQKRLGWLNQEEVQRIWPRED